MKTCNWKRSTLIFFIFSMTLSAVNSAACWAATSPQGLVVSYIEGNARFRTDANAPWQTIMIGQSLYPQYEVKTLPSTRMTVRLADGSEVRVAPNSHLRINPQTDTEVSQFDFQLILGRAWAKFRKNVRLGAKLILRTAHAKINVRGTSYEASVSGDQTQIRVFSGQVAVSASSLGSQSPAAPTEVAPPHEVSREEWQVIVSAFYTISVSKNQRPAQPQAFRLDSVQNNWVSWNLEQDQDI